MGDGHSKLTDKRFVSLQLCLTCWARREVCGNLGCFGSLQDIERVSSDLVCDVGFRFHFLYNYYSLILY